MRNVVFIKIQTFPLLQKIEHRDWCRTVASRNMPKLSDGDVSDDKLAKEAKNRFNQHPVVTLATPTPIKLCMKLSGAEETMYRFLYRFKL